MSATLSLEFPAETKFPTVEEWFHAAENAGFGLQILRDPELPTKLAKLDSWLVGVTYEGDETRFHFFVAKHKRGEPQGLWFECHDESEMTVATILGAVLMQVVLDGRMEDPQTGEEAGTFQAAMRLAKKRHKAWMAATAPARKAAEKAARRVQPRPAYDQAEAVRIVEERLAALPKPPKDERKRGKLHRSTTLHAAVQDLFIEFLECLGFEADDKGHAVRTVNGVVQTLGVGAMRQRFRAHGQLAFKSSVTRKQVDFAWVSLDNLGPRQSTYFSLNEIGFEHEVMHCFVGIVRYAVPLFNSLETLASLLELRKRGVLPVGDVQFNKALLFAELGEFARAKAGLLKLLAGVGAHPRQIRAENTRFYEEALRGIEMLEKSGRPMPAVAKAAEPPPPSATPAEVLARVEKSWPTERLKAAAKMDEDRRAREIGDLFEELAAVHLAPLGFAAGGGGYERIVGEIRQDIGFQFLQGHFAFTVGLEVVEPPLDLLGMRQDGLDGDPFEFRSTAPSVIVRGWKETVRKLFAYTIPLFDQCDSLAKIWSLHEAGKLPLGADLTLPQSYHAAVVCERLGDMEKALALLEQARREKPGNTCVQAKLKELRRPRE